jgi:hypothetical protein
MSYSLVLEDPKEILRALDTACGLLLLVFCLAYSELHGVTTHKSEIFILVIMRASNPT